MDMCVQLIRQHLGFFTGMGIPVVIRSRVPWVWVWCGIWHTVTYCVPIPWCHGYVMGILPPGEHKFYGFETHFFSNLINFFHPVTSWCNQIWFCQPCVYILASYCQRLIQLWLRSRLKQQMLAKRGDLEWGKRVVRLGSIDQLKAGDLDVCTWVIYTRYGRTCYNPIGR